MAEVAALLGALGAVLVLVPVRREALVAGLALSGAAVALLQAVGIDRFSATQGALGLFGVLVLAAGAVVFVRYPALVTPAVLVAAPFRLPLDFGRSHTLFVGVARGGQTGRLLLLYAVLAAASLALIWRVLRGEPPRPVTREIAVPVAAFAAFASVSLLWSGSAGAARNLVEFFLLPFVVLVAVVARAPFAAWMPRVLAAISIALGLLFATVGLVEEKVHRLVFYTPSVAVGNAYSSFFRVTSLFRDPSLYGRQLVLAIGVVLVVAWYRRLNPLVAAGIVAILFAGLFFSYSQSSMAALFAAGLFVTLVGGDRAVQLVATAITVLLLAVGAAYGAQKLAHSSTQRVTSDRSRRVVLTARVFVHHPLAGVGIGSQPRASKELSSEGGAPTLFVSHTTPLTVAAELGIVGVALYAAVLAGAAYALVRVRRLEPVLGLALATTFLALFVHSCFYSGFFEDPMTWLVLGIAASFLAAHARLAEAA